MFKLEATNKQPGFGACVLTLATKKIQLAHRQMCRICASSLISVFSGRGPVQKRTARYMHAWSCGQGVKSVHAMVANRSVLKQMDSASRASSAGTLCCTCFDGITHVKYSMSSPAESAHRAVSFEWSRGLVKLVLSGWGMTAALVSCCELPRQDEPVAALIHASLPQSMSPCMCLIDSMMTGGKRAGNLGSESKGRS